MLSLNVELAPLPHLRSCTGLAFYLERRVLPSNTASPVQGSFWPGVPFADISTDTGLPCRVRPWKRPAGAAPPLPVAERLALLSISTSVLCPGFDGRPSGGPARQYGPPVRQSLTVELCHQYQMLLSFQAGKFT